MRTIRETPIPRIGKFPDLVTGPAEPGVRAGR